MKRFYIFCIVIFLSIGHLTSAHNVGGQITVHMNESGFSPNSIEITQGTTVVFENSGSDDHWPASDPHPTHNIYPEFDPKRPIPSGQTWSFTFNRVGAWGYHDHLFHDLKGKITVTDEDSPATSSPTAPSKSFMARVAIAGKNLWHKMTGIFSFIKTKTKPADAFHKPKEYKLDNVYAEVKSACPNLAIDCFDKNLVKMTDTYGPNASLEALDRLKEDKLLPPQVDDHQIAHEIGRETAKIFGVNGDSFLLCPTSFNYGCGHGFFEYVLGQSESQTKAIDLICGPIEANPSYSPKFKFYCYHGVGHGVLMATAYDLKAALDICDSLTTQDGSTGCWQGVFMENVNSGMRHEARPGIFSETNPLAPCDKVESKYQFQCYINHAGWLMTFFHDNLKSASTACVKASPEVNAIACLESIGLMVTNASWQSGLGPELKGQSFEATAAALCKKFPAGRENQCIVGAVDNIMNFDEMNPSRVDKFCSVVPSKYQEMCYQRIGLALLNQTVDPNAVKSACALIKGVGAKSCLSGAFSEKPM